MYVELIKNFFLADSRELMNVRAISASESKNVWLLLSRRRTSRSWKIFFRRFEQTDRRLSHFRLLSPKTFDSHLLDIIYVEFMKTFFLADSSELMGVRVISATWAQKRLIPTL